MSEVSVDPIYMKKNKAAQIQAQQGDSKPAKGNRGTRDAGNEEGARMAALGFGRRYIFAETPGDITTLLAGWLGPTLRVSVVGCLLPCL